MDEDAGNLSRRQLGGVSILLGNAALFANGLIAYKHGDSPEVRKAGAGRMLSAALYTGTGAIISRYGHSSISTQLERLEEKLAAFMQHEGVPLDAGQLRKADAENQKG